MLTLADGQQIPQEGFGLYKVHGQETMNQAISDAYATGYRLFDTAQLYKNEAEGGVALHRLSVPRDQFFVTTKIAETNQGYQRTIASLRNPCVNFSSMRSTSS